MTRSSIRLYQTAEHGCGYFADRTAQDLLLDPHDPALPLLYADLLALGFRRSGGHVYRPRCPGCRACVPLRLPVAQFRPDRSQRRCLARNADVRLEVGEVDGDDATYALYRRYITARHAGGGMDQGERSDFLAFASSPWSPTRLFRLLEGDRLLAVAVTDVVDDAISAVYTFFEPDLPQRGLGTLAVLRQIEWALAHGRSHLYLGFWIEQHPKMHYKARFRPAEVLIDGAWQALACPSAP